MDVGNYNIFGLTQVLYSAMSGISTNIFTRRPKSTDGNMNDFVVVSFPNTIYDRLGLGNTVCVISIYAKDIVRNNVFYEDISKLGSMQTNVYKKLPITHDKCIIGNPKTVPMGTDKLGFHYVNIICDVIIK